jgi:hypothetical protein
MPLSSPPDALGRLKLLTEATRTVADRIVLERLTPPDEEYAADQLGLVMRLMRGLEWRRSFDLCAAARRCPPLRDKVSQRVISSAPHVASEHSQAMAVELARRDLRQNLEEFQRELPELGEEMASRRREQITAKLKRLALGRGGAVSAVMNAAGQTVTQPAEIAEAFRAHWGDTFVARHIDRVRLRRWLAQDRNDKAGLLEALRPHVLHASHWRLRRADVGRAVKMASKSLPGPDGIPHPAWQQLGQLAVNTLYDAALALS